MAQIVNEYEWDVAISLTKQDVGFARKLVKSLNPSLNVFFYENRQEELISNSGPEEFGKIFKEKSRIVVILTRNEWSESYYTEIERNAIIDRTAVKNQGFQFLMIIPMVPNEIPSWYPSTRIYANPQRFTIEDIARFIEFKVTEEGGLIKTITIEERYRSLLIRIKAKKTIIRLQETKNAIDIANNEVKVLKECFNNKINFLNSRENIVGVTPSVLLFNDNSRSAYFSIENYLLKCEILMDEMYQRIVSTQDFCILFAIYNNNDTRKPLETEKRIFYYTGNLNGWALQYIPKEISNKEIPVLFSNRNIQYYDLKEITNTTKLVDEWFQKLLLLSTKSIEHYL